MSDDAFDLIRSRVVGEGVVIPGPYGSRRMTYVDHAASGRLYGPIEDWLRVNAGGYYGNTHSETSHVAAQTTHFREEARDAIKAACGCGPDDAVVFTGSGATGAISALIGCLGWSLPCCFKDRFPGLMGRLVAPADRPVVFVSKYEHHSVLLPLREAEIDLVEVPSCGDALDGGVDVTALEALLAEYASRATKVGCFSAASNVTGRLTDVDALARAMHLAGGLVFFDYAAAGPYAPIRMGASTDGGDPFAWKDAVFISPHKFLGGPGAPGVLVAKRSLFANRVPHVPGGGTVSWVTPSEHAYLADVEHREEGGTPNILGAIKAGLAFRLKESLGVAAILEREARHAAELVARLRATPGVAVLGDLEAPRLGIVSFLVGCHGDPHVQSNDRLGRILHHNFVVALLNDLFGVQARGGNSCAAAFSHRLLGVSGERERALGEAVAQGQHGAKPGWTRVSFGHYDSDDTVAFVAACVRFIAARGHLLLDDYAFSPASGTWRRRDYEPELLGLDAPVAEAAILPEEARWAYLVEAEALAVAREVSGERALFEPTPFEELRWFALPGERA